MATNSEKYSGLAAALLGMGCMAAVDEIIFHQILAWHHFYDGATTAVALMSDGFLHAAELVAMRDHDPRQLHRLLAEQVRPRRREVVVDVLLFPAIDQDDLAIGRFDDRAVALPDIDEANL